MARTMREEMKIIRRYVDDADFLEALDKAPPEIIDRRSWRTGIRKWGPIRHRLRRHERSGDLPLGRNRHHFEIVR